MLTDNYIVISSIEILYIGQLTKEATLKQASFIVVEFTDPEMANAIIYAGMVWEGQVHQCQLYDRACRVKPQPIECPEISPSEIETAVRRTAPNKAPGTDDIQKIIFHQTLDILLPYLYKLFNACLQQQYCSSYFKEAITVVL